MSKRPIFSFVLCFIVFSAYSMQQQAAHQDDGPGNFSDELLDDTSIREEVYGFKKDRLLKKRLDDVDDRLSQQIMQSQGGKLRDLVDDLKDFHKTKFSQSGRIFVGSPGCGKSTMAKYIPQKYGYNCYFLKSSIIADRFKASGSQNLKLLFDLILDDQSPRVLIMDEINALTDKSGKANDTDSDMATTLWEYLDDCERNKNILWIATSNNCDDLPEQLKDRVEIFKFKDPSFSERKDIIKYYLGFHNGLSLGTLSLLTFCWEGKSARTIKKDLNKVLHKKGRQNVDGNFTISFNDIRQNGLNMQWPRCKKIKTTLYEHPGAALFMAGCGFTLGMYYLQHIHALAMHSDGLKQAADLAEKAQKQSADFHREGLAQSLKFHVEDRFDRRIDGLISTVSKWLNPDTVSKLLPPDSLLALEILRTVPVAVEKMGGDHAAVESMQDSVHYGAAYLVLQHGLPWIIGGPVAPAVIYGLMGLYVVGNVYIVK